MVLLEIAEKERSTTSASLSKRKKSQPLGEVLLVSTSDEDTDNSEDALAPFACAPGPDGPALLSEVATIIQSLTLLLELEKRLSQFIEVSLLCHSSNACFTPFFLAILHFDSSLDAFMHPHAASFTLTIRMLSCDRSALRWLRALSPCCVNVANRCPRRSSSSSRPRRCSANIKQPNSCRVGCKIFNYRLCLSSAAIFRPPPRTRWKSRRRVCV